MHAPMSEMIMFNKKTVGDTTFTADQLYGVGSFTLEMYDKTKMKKYAQDVKPLGEDARYENGRWEWMVNTNPVYMVEAIERLHIGAVFGIPTGIDVTYQLPFHFYATGLMDLEPSLNVQGQFILQKRILNSDPLGLSLGMVVNRNNFGVNYEEICTEQFAGELICLFEDPNRKYLQTTSLGIRSVITLIDSKELKRSGAYLYMFGSYNYDLDMEFTYPKIGVSIGLY